MKGILGDFNIQGYVDHLVAAMRAEPWKLFWDHLRIQYYHFQDVGLVRESLDSEIWQTCQQRELVLLTDNRNQNDPDSHLGRLPIMKTGRQVGVFLDRMVASTAPQPRLCTPGDRKVD